MQINTLLLIVGAAFVLYEFQHQFKEIREIMLNSTVGSIFFYFTMFILAFKVLFLIYLFYHFLKYKPIDSVANELLPTCTIIVPAYNEGRFVFDTLTTIANSDYPRNKIQLIAIDDGSEDDTWEWMSKAKSQLGDFLTIYQQPENLGKRHALYRGFNLAKGEVLVTIDSDSLSNTSTL